MRKPSSRSKEMRETVSVLARKQIDKLLIVSDRKIGPMLHQFCGAQEDVLQGLCGCRHRGQVV